MSEPQTNLDRFYDIARTKKPAAVIIDGDLTGGLPEDYAKFENHMPQDDSLRSFYVVGNHDLWYNGWGEFYTRFGSSSYYFTVKTPAGSDLFICIDTGGSTLGQAADRMADQDSAGHPAGLSSLHCDNACQSVPAQTYRKHQPG